MTAWIEHSVNQKVTQMCKKQIVKRTVAAIRDDIIEIENELIRTSIFSLRYAELKASISYAEEIIADLEQSIEIVLNDDHVKTWQLCHAGTVGDEWLIGLFANEYHYLIKQHNFNYANYPPMLKPQSV